jgi:hypothetical protein
MDLDPHVLLANKTDPFLGRRSSGWKRTPLPPVKKFAILLIFLVAVIGGRGKGEILSARYAFQSGWPAWTRGPEPITME